jgi:hypothetical protein
MATEQTHQGAAEASGNRQEDVWLCVCVSPLACARWQTDVDCISLMRSATFLASLTRQSTSPEPDVRSHKAIHVCALVPPVVVAASIHTNFPTLPYKTKQNKTKQNKTNLYAITAMGRQELHVRALLESIYNMATVLLSFTKPRTTPVRC